MSFYLSVITSLKSECDTSEKFKLVEEECLRVLTQQASQCAPSLEVDMINDLHELTKQIDIELDP